MLRTWIQKTRNAFRLRGRAATKQPGTFSPGRSRIVSILVYTGFAVLGVRAAVVHLFHGSSENLNQIADRQYQVHLDLAPYRGTIHDRRGVPLAISIRRPSLAINPRVFAPDRGQIDEIARILRKSPREVKLLAERTNYFAWLDRQVPHRAADRILAMKLPGIYAITEPARYYPAGDTAAHLLGYTGTDNRGLLGLEFQYEKDLRGQAVRLTPSRDAHGQTIFSDGSTVVPDEPGHNVHLTIDRVIQEIAEEALNQGARAARAKRGFALVSDPHTGRILAAANYPPFDANEGRQLPLARTRNYAMLDTFEPGSSMKTFVIAAALAKNRTTPEERHNCEKGVYRAGGTVFRDDHPADFLSTAETLVRSSNICTFKIAERMGKNALFELLTNYGFGGTLGNGTGFPGTATGRLSRPDTWKPIRFANIAFGQGLTATGLEIAQAYGAIANGGNLMRPTLVDRIESAKGIVLSNNAPEVLRRVTTPDVAKKMRQILARVVTDPRGTGSKAVTTSWTTAGKTGTSEKVDPKTRKYSDDLRLASFAGFAPVNDPFLVIYVVIDEPAARPAYGGLWAAPVFAEISERSLRYLNVAPDKEAPESSTAKPRVGAVSTPAVSPTSPVATGPASTRADHDRNL